MKILATTVLEYGLEVNLLELDGTEPSGTELKIQYTEDNTIEFYMRKPVEERLFTNSYFYNDEDHCWNSSSLEIEPLLELIK